MANDIVVRSYKKINMVNEEDWDDNRDNYRFITRKLLDKTHELVIEYNHLAKDFELYKKAHIQHMVDHH